MAVKTDLLSSNRNVTREILDQEILVRAYIDTTVTPLVSGDFYRLFYRDDNTYINEVIIITETVEGAADTIDVCDDEAATTVLCNDHDLNTDNAMLKYVTGIFKPSAGYISLRPNAAITAAKFWVVAKLIKTTTKD